MPGCEGIIGAVGTIREERFALSVAPFDGPVRLSAELGNLSLPTVSISEEFASVLR